MELAMTHIEEKIAEDTLFSKAVIRERFAHIYAAAKKDCEFYNKSRNRNIGIDRAMLMQTVWAAYDDIARYKLYHLDLPISKKSNAVKRAAYLTKWIVRNKPLIPMDIEHRAADDKSLSDDSILINSFFALRLSTRHLIAEGCPKFTLSADKWYEILYDFTYRELTGDALIMLYQMISDAAREEIFKKSS